MHYNVWRNKNGHKILEFSPTNIYLIYTKDDIQLMCCWKVDWKLFLLQAGLDLFCKDQQHPLFCKRTPRRGGSTRRAPSPSLSCLFSWLCVRHCCCMCTLRWHIYTIIFLVLQLRRQIFMILVSAAAADNCILILQFPFQCIPLTEKPYR